MIGAMPDRPTKITFAELREQAFAASWCIARTHRAALLQGKSPRRALPAKLCGLLRKYSRLPVAASAYWSMLTTIA
jgi:hypothetical protein